MAKKVTSKKAKKLQSLGVDSFEGSHDKPGQGSKSNRSKSVGSEQLGVFKGTRAGAKRKGSTHIDGYPDAPQAGNGHPGAHQA